MIDTKLQVLLTELQFLPTKVDASEEEVVLASKFRCSIHCGICSTLKFLSVYLI